MTKRTSIQPNGPRCPACGAEVSANARFCGKCGATIAANELPLELSKDRKATDQAQPSDAPADTLLLELPPQEHSSSPPKKVKKPTAPREDEATSLIDLPTPPPPTPEEKVKTAATPENQVTSLIDLPTPTPEQKVDTTATNAAASAITSSTMDMKASEHKCPTCGANVAANARFCGSCGTAIVAARTCHSCGAALSPSARFCKNCGASEDLVPAASPAPTTVSPTTAKEERASSPTRGEPALNTAEKKASRAHNQAAPIKASPAQSSKSASHPAASPGRREGGPPRLLFGVVGLVVVAFIAWFAFFSDDGSGGGNVAYSGLPSPRATTMAKQSTAAPSAPKINNSAYQPKPVVSGQTTKEEKTVTTTTGISTTVSLSDGTKVELPAMDGQYDVTLARESNTLDLRERGQATTGSARVLTIKPKSGSAQSRGVMVASAAPFVPALPAVSATEGEKNPNIVPIFTIPAKEAGDIQLINAVRKSDLIVDGEMKPSQIIVLPTSKDTNGNIQIRDVAYPQTTTGAPVTFVLSSPQDNLNWSIDPKLVRMVPADNGIGRKLFSSLSNEEKEKESKKTIRNVVLLVHGHNEAEYRGFEKAEVEEPWRFAYKRNVWNSFYTEFRKDYSSYLDCTAFYEFIYPTYRPVFVPWNGSDALGTSLARDMAYELAATPELQALANEGKLNIYVVAHSMGGLVSRAGVNEFSEPLQKCFKKLVTWGTPHHGSPLVTMRYLLTGGYNLDLPQMCANTVPGAPVLSTLSQFSFYQAGADLLAAADTPGEADLRWDNSQPLNLAAAGWSLPHPIGDYPDFLAKQVSLENGTNLYNTNLAAFNQRDKFKDRYVALYGITTKPVPAGLTGQDRDYVINWSCDGLIAFARYGQIGQGNMLIRWLYNTTQTVTTSDGSSFGANRNDGAVPVGSESGASVIAENIYVGDVDHEEYFGTPEGNELKNPAKAEQMDKRTLALFDFKPDGEQSEEKTKQCDCPALKITSPKLGDQFANTTDTPLPIEAKLLWPGQAKPPVESVNKIIAVIDNQTPTMKVLPIDLKISPDGTISGEGKASDVGQGQHMLTLAVQFKGGAQLWSSPIMIKVSGGTGVFRRMPEVKRVDPEKPRGINCTFDIKPTDTSYSAKIGYRTKLPDKNLPEAQWPLVELQVAVDATWQQPPDELTPGDLVSLPVSVKTVTQANGWQGDPGSGGLTVSVGDIAGGNVSGNESKEIQFTVPSPDDETEFEITYSARASGGMCMILSDTSRTFVYRYYAK